MKDHHMVELWDDLAVRVEENTGRRLSPAEHDPAPFASLVAVYVSREEFQAVRALLLTPKLAWTSEGRMVPYGEVHERVGALLGRVASAEAVPQCSRCGRPESPTCCGLEIPLDDRRARGRDHAASTCDRRACRRSGWWI